jgi:hypothetical protein
MLRIVRTVLIVFAYIFVLIMAVFVLGVGFMGWLTGEAVQFKLIPVLEGPTLVNTLLGLGIFGLLALLLAWRGGKLMRLPMVLCNVVILSLLVSALARSSYRFDGIDDFWNLVYITLFSILALAGSWMHLRRAGAPG